MYHKVTGMYSVRYDVEVTPKNNYELTSGTCTLVLPVYYEYYVFNTKLKQWRDIQVTINLSSYSKATGSANITTGVQPVGTGVGGSYDVTELSAEQYITTTTYLPEILILSSILTMSIIIFFVYKNKKNKQKELLANQSDLSNNQIIN